MKYHDIYKKKGKDFFGLLICSNFHLFFFFSISHLAFKNKNSLIGCSKSPRLISDILDIKLYFSSTI